jgi:hypothetical protein
MRKLIISFICIIVIYFSCDIEKFTGSKYEATPIPTTAKIYGKVYNTFDNLPVFNAKIMVDSQSTYTDSSGNYFLNYSLGPDENRNKHIPICCTAPQYQEFNSESVIYPENTININMDYGAPIVQKIARVDTICQAIIFDYQGFNNIDSVSGQFYYTPPGVRIPVYTFDFSMEGIEGNSPNIGYFQCFVPTEIDSPEQALIHLNYRVTAYDKSGFTDSTSYFHMGVDTLLFPLL